MKRNGFTLVELLAIIGILSLIAVLVVPRISKSTKEVKEEQYRNTIKIIENAARAYHADNKNVLKVTVQTLKDEKLLTSDLKDPRNDSSISGCVRVSKDSDGVSTYTYSTSCGARTVSLTVNLNGGSTSQTFQSTYSEGTNITLTKPTKSGYRFTNWTITSGDSVVVSNTLVIGSTNSTLTANWVQN